MPLAATQAEADAFHKQQEEKVRGQVRTHLVAAAMPTLLMTIDVKDEAAVKALLEKWTTYVCDGK